MTPEPQPHGTPPALSRDELRRYGRHLVLPEVGEAGQRRLKGASVLLVGAGGLGSPAALYLAAAGVGTLGIVDFDVVDALNLQRQVLHGTPPWAAPRSTRRASASPTSIPHVAHRAPRERLDSDQRARAPARLRRRRSTAPTTSPPATW